MAGPRPPVLEMSLPPRSRALRRHTPTLVLLALGLALVLRGSEGAAADRSLLLALLAPPILGQAALALLRPRRLLLAQAVAIPSLALPALLLGPSLDPTRPLWLLAAVLAAIPRRGVPPILGVALAGVLAAGAGFGLHRAGLDTATLLSASLTSLTILGVGVIVALAAAPLPEEDPSATLADLHSRLAEEEATTATLRRERAAIARDAEERLIILQANNRSLEREVQELRSAKEQALEASRIKSSFLANVSHELRTPLNAIIGYTEMLLEAAEEREDSAGIDDQRSVRIAADNLLKIIDDVLDLTKIEAGKLEIQPEVFPVLDLIEALGTAALPLARRNGNTLKLKYSRDLGYLRTDRAKLNRVLLDLLSNACKFTREGRVELRVDSEVTDNRRFFVFSVSDTGIGIAPEVLDRLFEPFRMADESSTREHGGLGLGLALAKHFTEMLGGELTVTSTPGEGSIFQVRVPVEAEDPRAQGHILVSMF